MNGQQEYSIPFKNVSSETVPAFGTIAITGVVYENGVLFLQGTKHSSTYCRKFALNGAGEVAPGQYGGCFRSGDMRIAYDPSASPTNGDSFGPKSGEWVQFKNQQPTTIVHGSYDATNKFLYGSFSGDVRGALILWAVLDEDMSAADATVDITSVTSFTRDEPPAITTASNSVLGLAGQEGDKVVVIEDIHNAGPVYWIVQVAHHAVDFVRSVEVSGDETTLDKITRAIAVMSDGDGEDEDPVTIADLDDCS